MIHGLLSKQVIVAFPTVKNLVVVVQKACHTPTQPERKLLGVWFSVCVYGKLSSMYPNICNLGIYLNLRVLYLASLLHLKQAEILTMGVSVYVIVTLVWKLGHILTVLYRIHSSSHQQH